MDDLTLVGMTKLQARQLMDLMTNNNNAKSPRHGSPRNVSPWAPQSPLLPTDSPLGNDSIDRRAVGLRSKHQHNASGNSRSRGTAASPRSGRGNPSTPSTQNTLSASPSKSSPALALKDRAAKIKETERMRAEKKRTAEMPIASPSEDIVSPTSPTRREARRAKREEIKAEKAKAKAMTRSAWDAVLHGRRDQSRPGELFEGRLLMKIAPGKYFGNKWEQRYVIFDRRSKYMDVFVEDVATKESTFKVASAESVLNKGLGRKNQILVTSASAVNKEILSFSAASEREQLDWLRELPNSNVSSSELKIESVDLD